MGVQSFDLVVIGTGTAASVAASRCRRAGWSVAVIDELPFGGTCALRGCDPKKVLVGNAEAVEWARRLSGKGVRQDGLHIEWPELMRFKRSMIAQVPERKEEGFRKAGIAVFHGQARFTGRATLEVAGQRLEGKRVLIASGAKPVPLGIPGEELLTTSTQFLELDELPRRIVFVGGGFISFEFAHVAIRAGAQVTILTTRTGDRWVVTRSVCGDERGMREPNGRESGEDFCRMKPMNPEEIRRFSENQAAAALRERVETAGNPLSAAEAFRAALALLRFDEACGGSPFAREDRVSQAEDELVRGTWARLRAKWPHGG